MKDMLGREDAITPDKALSLILSAISPAGKTERISIEASFRKVLADDILSPEDLPGFARSTVDGYAVIAEDTFGAQSYLNLVGEIPMGEAPLRGISRGETMKIATGGMLPPGADAVVMFEHVEAVSGNMIEVLKPSGPGGNTIRPGEDAKKGEPVISRGRLIRPQDAAMLAGLGITEIEAFARPRVSIISTGDEVVPNNTENPAPGLIRDTNGIALSGMIVEDGGAPERAGIFPDDYAKIKNAVMKSVSSSDMVLISGGSSVGLKDMTARIISEAGRLLFHSISMRPGKPMMAGIIDGKPVFGLPGHPVAATVCYWRLVRPALYKLAGVAPLSRIKDKTVIAVLGRSVRSEPGMEEHIRVGMTEENGVIAAIPILGKSGLLSTLVKADGILVVPPDTIGFASGEHVEIRLF